MEIFCFIFSNVLLFRWDKNAVEDLPGNMKILYSTFLNVFDEIEEELKEEDGSYKVSSTKEMVNFLRVLSCKIHLNMYRVMFKKEILKNKKLI